jgi:DNA-binding response OmpR family regulator
MARRILVVDDEPALRALLVDYLGAEGFEVRAVEGGAAMRAEMARAPADLVILDLNLPGESGLQLAREVAATSRAGILMLTAMGELPERLAGLRAGADDYMAKPFEPRELLARLRSILRRLGEPAAAAPPSGATVPFGRHRLDLEGRRLQGPSGEEVALTAMEFDLLAVFARHPRQVLSRDQLCRQAHGRELEAFDRSIDIRITRLRKKLEPDPDNPTVLRTVRGEGYVFEPDA